MKCFYKGALRFVGKRGLFASQDNLKMSPWLHLPEGKPLVLVRELEDHWQVLFDNGLFFVEKDELFQFTRQKP